MFEARPNPWWIWVVSVACGHDEGAASGPQTTKETLYVGCNVGLCHFENQAYSWH